MEGKREVVRIPEITRVEGHAAVRIEIEDGKVKEVFLDVFEGARFFEKIVLSHHFSELPHLTSRVCAICSTGHVLAAILAVEDAIGYKPTEAVTMLRELMHLGMIIESHATHIYALALPDFVGACDLVEFASKFQNHFEAWSRLRNLGAAIQSKLGGRPFHPVNLQVGGFSSFPSLAELNMLAAGIESAITCALNTCELLQEFKPPTARLTPPVFAALVPAGDSYGYFGTTLRTSDGREEAVKDYRRYLGEQAVGYSHAKRSSAMGKPLMVGSLSRLYHFHEMLGGRAREIFQASAMANGDFNTIWNNLSQAIEIVEAMDRCLFLISKFKAHKELLHGPSLARIKPQAGMAAAAVECPRGTLYHYYELDEKGLVRQADMVTPSAQNTYCIETDIKEVVARATNPHCPELQANLETLVRAYDPCNTCATHMVSIKYTTAPSH